MYRFIVWFLPALLAAVIGARFGAADAGYYAGAIWLFCVVYAGRIELADDEYAIVERSGEIRMIFRGRHWLVVGADRVREREKLPRLFVASFDAGGCTVSALVRCCLGRPEDISIGHWGRVQEDVRLWHMTGGHDNGLRESHVYRVVRHGMRPVLKAWKRGGHCMPPDPTVLVAKRISKQLETFGLHLVGPRPVEITPLSPRHSGR